MNQKRIFKWDNVKCFLIFSVVLGHFSNQFISESGIMRMITLFIYSFHMPLFIFISGLLTKPLKNEEEFSWQKPIYFIIIGYFLKFVTFMIKTAYGRNPVFDFFGDTSLPWYMFAMAAFLMINYNLRKLTWKMVLPLSVLFACIVGYFPQVGSFLYLSRIIVFFPFYYLGYILQSDEVIHFCHTREIRIMSVATIMSAIYYCTICLEDTFAWLRMFTARNCYEAIHIEECWGVHRLIFYMIAIFMGIAIISLVPDRPCKLAEKIGRNTLQIYAWHRAILYIIVYSGLADYIQTEWPAGWIAVILLLGALTVIILAQPIFALPLDFLKNIEIQAIQQLQNVMRQVKKRKGYI